VDNPLALKSAPYPYYLGISVFYFLARSGYPSSSHTSHTSHNSHISSKAEAKAKAEEINVNPFLTFSRFSPLSHFK
jgi:hypothetical protein